MVRGSFAWKCEGKVVRKSGLQRGVFFVRDSFPWKHEGKVARKSGLQRGVVLDQRLIYTET